MKIYKSLISLAMIIYFSTAIYANSKLIVDMGNINRNTEYSMMFELDSKGMIKKNLGEISGMENNFFKYNNFEGKYYFSEITDKEKETRLGFKKYLVTKDKKLIFQKNIYLPENKNSRFVGDIALLKDNRNLYVTSGGEYNSKIYHFQIDKNGRVKLSRDSVIEINYSIQSLRINNANKLLYVSLRRGIASISLTYIYKIGKNGELKQIDYVALHPMENMQFSPDGKWIVGKESQIDSMDKVYVYKVYKDNTFGSVASYDCILAYSGNIVFDRNSNFAILTSGFSKYMMVIDLTNASAKTYFIEKDQKELSEETFYQNRIWRDDEKSSILEDGKEDPSTNKYIFPSAPAFGKDNSLYLATSSGIYIYSISPGPEVKYKRTLLEWPDKLQLKEEAARKKCIIKGADLPNKMLIFD